MKFRSPNRNGFTLIEVMMALAVMTIGAMGIISMQRATIRGNMTARATTTANQITRTWLERVRTDALSWNTNQMAGVLGTNYLATVPPVGPTAWFAPVPNNGAESWGFDYSGRDTRNPDQMEYCTHIQTQWIQPGEVAKVTVRTWWYRNTLNDRTVFPNCGVGAEGGVDVELNTATSRLRSVQSAIVLRWSPL